MVVFFFGDKETQLEGIKLPTYIFDVACCIIFMGIYEYSMCVAIGYLMMSYRLERYTLCRNIDIICHGFLTPFTVTNSQAFIE